MLRDPFKIWNYFYFYRYRFVITLITFIGARNIPIVVSSAPYYTTAAHTKKAASFDAAFEVFAKYELLCCRCFYCWCWCCNFFFHFFFHCFFHCFFVFDNFLYFFILYFNFTGRACSSSFRFYISFYFSSENYSGERKGYEGGYECGQNFFHLYYLQRECV